MRRKFVQRVERHIKKKGQTEMIQLTEKIVMTINCTHTHLVRRMFMLFFLIFRNKEFQTSYCFPSSDVCFFIIVFHVDFSMTRKNALVFLLECNRFVTKARHFKIVFIHVFDTATQNVLYAGNKQIRTFTLPCHLRKCAVSIRFG